VFVANNAGDADWYLEADESAGFRFNVRVGGVAGANVATQITTDGFEVHTATEGFSVFYGPPFRVTVVGLPTADPTSAGQLYSDGVPSAGVPKALKVSGG
jgi:hypothetical protein